MNYKLPEQINNNSIDILQYPTFCKNETAVTKTITTSCTSSHTVNAYPGEVFQVPLMVVDDSCIPSKGIIQVKVKQDGNASISLGNSKDMETFKQSKKYCTNYQFSVTRKFSCY